MSKRNKNQGTKYEKRAIKDLGLTANPKERSQTNLHDATLDKFTIELKSVDISKKYPKVSTGRGFGLTKIKHWYNLDAFIFTVHDEGKVLQHRLITKKKMQKHIDKIKKMLEQGSLRGDGMYLGNGELNKIFRALAESYLSDRMIERTENTLLRGAKLNDPRWIWCHLLPDSLTVSSSDDILEILENE